MKIFFLLFATLLCGATSSMASPGTNKARSMVMDFNKGVSTLSPTQKDDLRKILIDFKAAGKDVDIEVAAWADEPFPGNSEELDSDQRRIATYRLEGIKRYLSDLELDIDDLKVYNMAESSNWLAKLFDSDGNEVREALSKERENDTAMKEKIQTFKDNGAPGKSVVFIRYDD